MTAGKGTETDDRIVLGYFGSGAQADRAIDELMDEGFGAAEIGAALRMPGTMPGMPGGNARGREAAGGREESSGRRGSGGGSVGFGMGEGWFRGNEAYCEAAFEDALTRLGLDFREAYNLSVQLRRGGAVVSVYAGDRASLAEGILERNHGRVRFDAEPAEGEEEADPRVEIYGRMGNVYWPEDAEEIVRGKAS